MKIIKRLSIAIAILIATPLIAALFIRKTFTIEREVVINKPKNEVFAYVKRLKNQETYSKWLRLDPKTKFSYRGTDGTAGAVMAWSSENQDVGIGEQEIKKITEGERVDVEIRFTAPFVSTDPSFTAIESVNDGQTKVRTVYFGKFPYPMNLLCFYVEDKIGKDMQTTLLNLKEILEKNNI